MIENALNFVGLLAGLIGFTGLTAVSMLDGYDLSKDRQVLAERGTISEKVDWIQSEGFQNWIGRAKRRNVWFALAAGLTAAGFFCQILALVLQN